MSTAAESLAARARGAMTADTLEPGGPAWYAERRLAAADRVEAEPVPRPKAEPWRYTPLNRLAAAVDVDAAPAAAPADAAWVESLSFDAFCEEGEAAMPRVVVVDGHLDPGLSSGDLPEGLSIRPLSAVLAEDPQALEPWLAKLAGDEANPFVALSRALSSDGLVVQVAPFAQVEQPVHLVFANHARNAAYLTHPCLLVLGGNESRASLVLTHAGAAGAEYAVSLVTEVALGEAAHLTLVKDVREADGATHLESFAARLDKDADLGLYTANLGGGLVRNEVRAHLAGPFSHLTLVGMTHSQGDEHVENQTLIDHAVPDCTSDESYKSVLDGTSVGVFRGQVLVRPDAQRTDSQQQNKALLLGRDAVMNTKPELEIYADDVKAAHGAAVGQLDEDALFYLRSRGLSPRVARQLLIQAFAREQLERIPVPAVRAGLKQMFQDRVE